MSAETSPRVQKILVIDDNTANCQVAEGHLVAAGYAVSLAENGKDGIALFREWRPDLVLLDILMPGMDGFETCLHLKSLPKGRDVPVVFLTALGDLGSHQKAIESGADDFLTKPINRTELLIRVRSLLWVKRLKDELSVGYELIQSQRDALIHAQRQKEELSALVVHDLKNPLSAILANTQFLLEGASLNATDRVLLQDVESSAESMHSMVMNLLDISRSEDGTLLPRFSEVDIHALIEEICEATRMRCERRNMQVTFVADISTVRADRDLLKRLIENLFDNGLKYTPPGGKIHVQVQTVNNQFVEIRVNDAGPGVPEKYRERVFEKYFQIDKDVEVQVRNSRGLGLAFCRLAAEAHGGRIWIEDNQPKGSSFCVHLPIAAHD